MFKSVLQIVDSLRADGRIESQTLISNREREPPLDLCKETTFGQCQHYACVIYFVCCIILKVMQRQSQKDSAQKQPVLFSELMMHKAKGPSINYVTQSR